MSAIDLASLELFEGLSPDDTDRCVEMFQQRDYVAGESLASEGDFSYKFFVVLDGEVDVHRDFDFVARLGQGDFFGEAGVVDGERRNARVTTHTRCTLAWVMSWDFATMTENVPSVAERIDAVLAARRPPD